MCQHKIGNLHATRTNHDQPTGESFETFNNPLIERGNYHALLHLITLNKPPQLLLNLRWSTLRIGIFDLKMQVILRCVPLQHLLQRWYPDSLTPIAIIALQILKVIASIQFLQLCQCKRVNTSMPISSTIYSIIMDTDEVSVLRHMHINIQEINANRISDRKRRHRIRRCQQLSPLVRQQIGSVQLRKQRRYARNKGIVTY